ncbi:MAG: M23 family metallopeptidase [Treponema sp.]|nr:M23 family metallopeptidase [Treponema sp.]
MNTNRIRAIIIFIAAAVALPPYIQAFDWPIQNGKALKNFGMNDKGQPERGILFAKEDSVFPADAGEVLFVSSYKKGGTYLQPLGNWMAIQHQDALIGIYSHLSDFAGPVQSSVADVSIPIAKTGSSGWAIGPQLQFSVYDRKTSGYVNPQLLINLIDTRPPVVRQTIFVGRDGQRIILGQTKSLRQGLYRVLVDAYDMADLFGNYQVAPYQFSLFINGSLQGQLDLDMISVREGKFHVNLRKGQRTDLIYQADGSYLIGEIQLSRGKVLCEIIVTDTAGNQKSQTYQINVE